MLIMKILFNVLVLLQIKMNDQNKEQCGVAPNLKRGTVGSEPLFFLLLFSLLYTCIQIQTYTHTYIFKSNGSM